MLFPVGECCDVKMWEAGRRKFNENHMLSGFASLMFMNIVVHKDSFTNFSYWSVLLFENILSSVFHLSFQIKLYSQFKLFHATWIERTLFSSYAKTLQVNLGLGGICSRRYLKGSASSVTHSVDMLLMKLNFITCNN